MESPFSRKVHQDAERAEGDPEIEVRVIEKQSQEQAEDGRDFAKRAAEEEGRLYTLGILVPYCTAHVLVAKDEGEDEEGERDHGKGKCDVWVVTAKRAGSVGSEQLGFGEIDCDYKNQLRSEKAEPNGDKCSIFDFDGFIRWHFKLRELLTCH